MLRVQPGTTLVAGQVDLLGTWDDPTDAGGSDERRADHAAASARARSPIASRRPARRSRQTLRVGYQVARDGRTYLEHVRAMWALAGRRSAPPTPSTATWLDQHRPLAPRPRAPDPPRGRLHHRRPRRVPGLGWRRPGAATASHARSCADLPGLDEHAGRAHRRRPAPAIRGARRSATDAELASVVANGDPRLPRLPRARRRRRAAARVLHRRARPRRPRDRPGALGRRCPRCPTDGSADPRFRPEWSPDTLLGGQLPRSLLRRPPAPAARRRAASSSATTPRGGTCSSVSTSTPTLVRRVPELLAHLGRRPDVGSREPAPASSARHLERPGLAATAEPGPAACVCAGRSPSRRSVTVIIPTRHNRPMLERCLPSLAAHRLPVRSTC